MSLKRRLFCDVLDLHVGYPEMVGESMTFYCTRCKRHVHPISPERTEAITRAMYDEEGYDYDLIHDERAQREMVPIWIIIFLITLFGWLVVNELWVMFG